MTALFINPPYLTEYGKYSRTSRSPSIPKSGTIYYPLWLAYAAAYCEDNGIQIDFVDSCATQTNEDETLERIRERNQNISLIVLDTSTPSIDSDIAYCRRLREAYPEALIFVMGTHVTAVSEEVLCETDTYQSVDGVIRGEADFTAFELASLCELRSRGEILSSNLLSEVEGIAYRDGGEVVRTANRKQIKDLDSLPFVTALYKKYVDVRDYFFGASDYPEVQIITSRGCVARCTFCVYPHTIHALKYRMRSAQNVFEEFQWINENLPEVRAVGIEDDTFSGSKKRTREFCRLMIESGLNKKIKWYSNERANLDKETMALMKEAGCHMITVGYESANETVLKNIAKGISTEQIQEFNENAKAAKIRVHSCFMVGNYGENKQTLKETLDFALKLSDDTMQFFPLIVYPGTPDYDRFKDEGLIEIDKYSDYLKEDGRMNGVVRTPDMSADELTDWCDFARKEYYVRPSYILRKLSKIMFDLDDFIRTAKSFSIFYKHLLRPVKYDHKSEMAAVSSANDQIKVVNIS